MADIDAELKNAMQICSNLSRDARAQADMPTMYAANRAWHELYRARVDLTKRRQTLARK